MSSKQGSSVVKRRLGQLRRGSSRIARRAPLSTAVLFAVLAAVMVAFAAYLVLHWVLPAGEDKIQPKDLTQFALAIVAGIGGVVALVVAYRRQSGIEDSRFVERFGAAASQLGHMDVAVRLAGVYAMAGVADEMSGHERQQCVDVLCAYLRLPYFPALGANHQVELQSKVPGRDGEERTQKFQYRQNEKEVRQTIVRVIAEHLREDAREPWSFCDFDLRGAVLEDADFSEALFAGRHVRFDGAVFCGATCSFSSTKFDGEGAFFVRATFSSKETDFDYAEFASGSVAWFYGARFQGTTIRFRSVCFDGPTSFVRTTYTSGETQFNGSRFGTTGFQVDFSEARFAGKLTSFFEARLDGVVFWDASFGAEKTDFRNASFSGQEASSFRSTRFGNHPVLFHSPTAWDPAPEFDWDKELPDEQRLPKPSNVGPQDWPPRIEPRKHAS